MEVEKNPLRPSKRKFGDFAAIKVTLASPDQILTWSHGEVEKAETINYRTLKPEVGGLMCEKIFGPTKNYECYCGKYRKVRYKGIICDKCGVEVTHNKVRRERMGHIKLAVPVTHVWYSYSIPNKIATILDVSQKKLLAVVYYTRYLITEVDSKRKKEVLPIIDEELKEKKEEENKELEERIGEIEKNSDKKIKELKKDKNEKDKMEFKIETLEHSKKRDIAALHKEFAEREEQIERDFSDLRKLVEKIEIGETLSEDEFILLRERNFLFFTAKMGAGAVQDLLSALDLPALVKQLRYDVNMTQSSAKRAKLISRLRLIEGLLKNNLRPDWMVLDVLPVIPPDLRPIIQLPGGKFATSDLNDLYRRVINRNNRLKRLMQIGAPDVILRNEKRMLQEAVDALIDNSHRPARPVVNLRRMPYKALTDQLRGKKGRFRRNLLGKRVDYSGRAVIIGSSDLTLNQCGLPKSMVLEMYRPFVIRELIDMERAPNIRVAKQLIDDEDEIVWDILEKLIDNRPVLLNRAPTLHKQGIQAFYPRLVEGDAIRIHPLVCSGYNADFDGDMMAVHIPLTEDAVEEARTVMLAQENIVSLADGTILAVPTKDMIIGLYLLTAMDPGDQPPVTFPSIDRAVSAHDSGKVTLSQKTAVVIHDEVVETSIGRVIFNTALPEGYPFVNEQITKSVLGDLVKEIVRKYPIEESVRVLDALKDFGFKYATELGYDLAMEDFDLDIGREELLEKGDKKELKLQEDYLMGLLTYDEKLNLSIELWNDITKEMEKRIWEKIDHDNSVSIQINSGAAKYHDQARQVIAMKGLLRDPEGNWVELPIKGNHNEGLSAFEYFAASRAARKGLADTALRTAKSGYLTRKFVDVAQDLIIRMDDCGVKGPGHTIIRDDEMRTRRVPFVDLIHGRWTAEKVVHPETGKMLARANQEITLELAREIDKAGVNEVNVRSPLTCEAPLGLCSKCYGYDIGNNKLITIGKAVGVIAAQALGEPATQMVLRTFHSGGAGETDITRGLPRLEELFEARLPKKAAFIAPFDAKATVEEGENDTFMVTLEGKKDVQQVYYLNEAKEVLVKDGTSVKDGEVMFVTNDEKEHQAPFAAKVEIVGNILSVTGKIPAIEEYTIPEIYKVIISDGDKLKTGQPITDGSFNPKQLFEVVGLRQTQEYIIDGVQTVYTEQGISMNDKHVECIVRQMGRMSKVIDAGNTSYLIGSFVNKTIANLKNTHLENLGNKPAYLSDQLMGITGASLKTESFLSAMSFQEQVRVLTEASLLGKVDYLRGLKENVIIGRMIPVGEAARIEDVTELEEFQE
jgi:DNA-directed RNA polymerase subunit beta'